MNWYLFFLFCQLLWKEAMLWCHWRIITQLHGFNVSYNEYYFENMSIIFFFLFGFCFCFVFLFAQLHFAQLYTFTYTWMFQCVSDMELISLFGFHAPFAIHVIFFSIFVFWVSICDIFGVRTIVAPVIMYVCMAIKTSVICDLIWFFLWSHFRLKTITNNVFAIRLYTDRISLIFISIWQTVFKPAVVNHDPVGLHYFLILCISQSNGTKMIFLLVVRFPYFLLLRSVMYFMRNYVAVTQRKAFELHCIHYAVAVDYFSYHIEAETKWPPFGRRHFQVHFLERKFMDVA